MNEFVYSNPNTTVAALLVLSGLVVIMALILARKEGLESIRKKVYDAFLLAEKYFQHGDNTKKFEYVVRIAKESIPTPYNLIINEKLLREIIQVWFDLVKDLLDDGKLNGKKN